MANTPKRRSLEKTPTEYEPPVTNGRKYYCCRCGIAYSRQKGYFPVSHSPMYRGAGYLPICSECIEDMYNKYTAELKDGREAMRRICMKMDLYWNDTIYDAMEKTVGVNSRVRNYIGKTNLIKYIDKSFDDTIKEEELAGIYGRLDKEGDDRMSFVPDEGDIVSKEEENIPQEYIDFWGKGYSLEHYEELDSRYKEWTADLGDLESSQRALYKQVAILESSIARDSARGKPVDKYVNTLTNVLGSLNIKPSQKKEDLDADTEKTPFGVWIDRWENKRPIPEAEPEFRDVDHIVKYVTTWFLGHLCKMLGIKNTYCKMYEEEISRLRAENPSYEEEDDEDLFNDIFSTPKAVSADDAE